MMKLLYILFFFACPILLFSQEIVKNKDGSISITADSMTYHDTLGNKIDENLFKNSLNTGKYNVSITETQNNVKFQLKKKYSAEDHPILQLGKEFPLIELENKNQNEIKEIGEKKFTLFTFWDINCKPCVEELTSLNALAEKYPKVCFIAITAATQKQVDRFLQEEELEWNNIKFITDSQLLATLSINIIPFNVAVDNKRIIKKIVIGKDIKEILSYFNAEK